MSARGEDEGEVGFVLVDGEVVEVFRTPCRVIECGRMGGLSTDNFLSVRIRVVATTRLRFSFNELHFPVATNR
jgi:hypothetical protein